MEKFPKGCWPRYVFISSSLCSSLTSDTGPLLKRKLASAWDDYTSHKKVYDDFMAALKPDNVKTWLEEVQEFEKNYATPDPYFIEPSGMLGPLGMQHY